MDQLSRPHFKAVWTEIQGRFFSRAEAQQLKDELDVHTITDPIIRAEAAKCWEEKAEEPQEKSTSNTASEGEAKVETQ